MKRWLSAKRMMILCLALLVSLMLAVPAVHAENGEIGQTTEAGNTGSSEAGNTGSSESGSSMQRVRSYSPRRSAEPSGLNPSSHSSVVYSLR